MRQGTYPSASGGGGQSYVYGYDAMGRLKTMGAPEAQTNVVSDVTYGPAGELLTMTGVVNETRSYSPGLQLTGLNGVSFGYGTTNNNGRIATETDTVSGETVVYQYDELNRLLKAETELAGGWGQQFTYDGFGNLTSKAGTAGHAAAPTMTVSVDRATNRVSGYLYDANGNQLGTNTQTLSYDYENRVSVVDNRNSTGRAYGYDPDNRRVYEAQWVLDDGEPVYSGHVVHFWGVTGQRMGTYDLAMDPGQPPYTGPSVVLTYRSDRVYFGGRMLRGDTGAWAGEDRLGSIGKFYPYGEARVGDPKRFATYERDEGGLDYAVNRYYWTGMGRFMSPDPYWGSGRAEDPASLNRYGYVEGDPVNFSDPTGLLASPCQWNDPGCQTRQPSDFGDCYLNGTLVSCFTVAQLFHGGAVEFEVWSPFGFDGLGMIAGPGAVPWPGWDWVIRLPKYGTGLVGLLIQLALMQDGSSGSARRCPPCTPYARGTLFYRHDRVPPSAKHYPYPGDHVHLYVVNQNPRTCKCYVNPAGDCALPPPPNALPMPEPFPTLAP